MYLTFIHKTPIILRLSKIITLNYTMHSFTILTCSLKINVNQASLNLISNNIFFAVKFIVFLYNSVVRRKKL